MSQNLCTLQVVALNERIKPKCQFTEVVFPPPATDSESYFSALKRQNFHHLNLARDVDIRKRMFIIDDRSSPKGAAKM